jgi:uncharacterized protein (TIGR02145 family)
MGATANTTNCPNLDLLDSRINRIMQKYPHILKIFLILGILVQTIACDKVPEDIDIDDNQLQTTQSSSTDLSSSSSSSSIENGSVTYQGQTYKTVKIGSQTWMAENLNYDAPGSECYEILYQCPDDYETCPDLYSYCDSQYGRLYDWATAMNIATTATNCAGDRSEVTNCLPAKPYIYQYHHQGICPAGWHIPKKAEWEELFDYANISSHYGAGVGLKAKTGWDEWYWVCPCEPETCVCTAPPPWRGEDIYGFAALPGGIGLMSDALIYPPRYNFSDMGKHGYWWSATEDTEYSAVNSRMSYNSGHADFSFAGLPSAAKNSKMSVRCVKN